MRGRCTNSRLKYYHRYGGRGIRVCERWQSFANFLADMGAAPSPQHTLDRFPNRDGDYEPGNCRWATRKEQSRNTCTNRLIEHDGETLCVAEWTARLGLSSSTIAKRLSRGESPATALSSKRRPGEVIEFRGERRRLHDLAKEHGISPKTVRSRMRLLGWTLERALTEPAKRRT